MPAFFEYMRNITYYLVFAAFIGILAPSGPYKKYISLVLGVLLIGIVLRPLPNWLNGQNPIIPASGWFSATLPRPMDIGDMHHEAVRDAFHQQLHTQAAHMLANNGFELIHSQWETSEDFTQIASAVLRVQALPKPEPTPRPFIRVEPIQIRGQNIGQTSPEAPDEALPIKNLISNFYNIPIANIHVEVVN